MLELIPVVIPNIDWKTYLTVANQVLGVSISTSFDGAKIPLNAKAFIVSTNDLTNTKPALDIDVSALKHLTYTFLVMLLEGAYTGVIEQSTVSFTSSNSSRPGIRLALVTGTLLQWKETVVSCSSSSNPDVKAFGNKAREYFESIGLSDIWKHYFKIQPSLKLVYKP